MVKPVQFAYSDKVCIQVSQTSPLKDFCAFIKFPFLFLIDDQKGRLSFNDLFKVTHQACSRAENQI